jgi:hypothetical protein
MRRSEIDALLNCALVFVFVLDLGAQEKRLRKMDLPLAVQKTAAEVSQGAEVKGYSSEMEQGHLQYEVELSVAGHSKDVTIAPDGAVLEVEEQVELASLSSAVQGCLQNKAGVGRITMIESITKRGALVAYEAHVRKDKKHFDIQVGPNGEDLAHQE